VTPHRVRRPTSPHGRRARGAARASFTRPIVTGLILLAVAGAAVAGAAACGGSSGSPDASPSATSSPSSIAGPTPVPTPQITSGRPPAGAVTVVRQYWTLLSAREYDAAFALTTGSHLVNAGTQPKEFESARYLRPNRRVLPKPTNEATVVFGSWVYIVPSANSPFGTDPRRWLMFAWVVHMSDGSWRLVSVGTGP
jgi:hypothetical protein